VWFQKISIPSPNRVIKNSKGAKGDRSQFLEERYSINQNWKFYGDWDGDGKGEGTPKTKKLWERGMDIFLKSTIPQISLHTQNYSIPKRNDNMMLYTYNKVPYSASDWLFALHYWIAKEEPDVSDRSSKATCKL